MEKSWGHIQQFYEELVASGLPLEAMQNLVAGIKRSRYAVGLHGWTSVSELCIAQTPVTYPYEGPYLRISQSKDGRLVFRYIDTSITDKQWHREAEGKKGFEQLERFIDQLHWFVKTPNNPLESSR